ncbi:ABC-F family ATP-binding cassette domain-containing protein [Arthrobacter castelli]|uniref:ABC-F family ATP-binding cassette domain-containing protein n=1 Tax=Arthrobacter castelli TaxID=271431 RepID=UPI00047C3F58|nr:ABC-F family ATP-binding cassette domain-containing protein [Arthrobacter castelli]
MKSTLILPARARAQLMTSGLCVNRGGRRVLSQVEMTVSPGSRWGVVGENGRGKSTLIQVLAGTLTPDEGRVQRIGTVGVADQEMASHGNRTIGQFIDEQIADARAALAALDEGAAALAEGSPGAEHEYTAALEAAEALDAWDADRRIDLALDRLDAVADRSRLLAELSVGQRYRVRLACLLGAEVDFLLLDEPTNHLDAAGLDFLTAKLREHAGGVVVVSHDRALLSDVVTTILDLDQSRDGLPRVYGDGFDGYRQGREAELQRWESEYERQQSDHARLTHDLAEARNRLSSGWRPDKGTGKHQRQSRAPGIVRSVNRRRDELQQHAITAPVPPLRFRMPELPAHPGVALVTADGVRVADRLHDAVDVGLASGSRLVVTGPNGSGKTTLLSVLSGRLEPTNGTVRQARNARVGLLPQESVGFARGGPEDVFGSHMGRLVSSGTLKEDEAIPLSQLGLLSAADLDKPARELSMGQQRRLDLAMVLASRPHVLLLDEPTNHLSIALVDELTDAFGATEACVVLASHDRQLLRDTEDWPRLQLSSVPAPRSPA